MLIFIYYQLPYADQNSCFKKKHNFNNVTYSQFIKYDLFTYYFIIIIWI